MCSCTPSSFAISLTFSTALSFSSAVVAVSLGACLCCFGTCASGWRIYILSGTGAGAGAGAGSAGLLKARVRAATHLDPLLPSVVGPAVAVARAAALFSGIAAGSVAGGSAARLRPQSLKWTARCRQKVYWYFDLMY